MSCASGKVGYDSKAIALSKAKLILRKRRKRDMEAYMCPICKQWHLTTKRQVPALKKKKEDEP